MQFDEIEEKIIPKWASMSPRFNKMKIKCAAPSAPAGDADKTVVGGGSGAGNKFYPPM